MCPEGLTVSFLKENSLGFYSSKDIEDISFPVLENEVIKLEQPESYTRNRVDGFKFPKNIKDN
jgi:hypothetical protein